MREPSGYPEQEDVPGLGLEEAFIYANTELHVGNFMRPALKLGVFSRVDLLNSRYALERFRGDAPVLDIDMDVFERGLSVEEEREEMSCLGRLIRSARFVTIATSPYFIGQERAVQIVKDLLKDEA